MAIWISVEVGAIGVVGKLGVRAGMLVGRYLDDPVLVEVVAEHVVTGWLGGRDLFADSSNVEHWWNGYVDSVEAAAGGVDSAGEDDLRRVWAEHARRLLRRRMADPLAADASPIQPEPVGAGR